MNCLVTETIKAFGKFKIETPKNIWIDESVCLRSKVYSLIIIGENTNQVKEIFKFYSKKYLI